MPTETEFSLQFCDRESAELMLPDRSIAVISITDPPPTYGPAKLRDGWHSVLRMVFSDFNMDKITNPYLRADVERAHPPLTPDQARTIVKFVGAALSAGATGFLVHCEAGISRSAAVARWIGERHGCMPTEHDLICHNTYVHRLLVEASDA